MSGFQVYLTCYTVRAELRLPSRRRTRSAARVRQAHAADLRDSRRQSGGNSPIFAELATMTSTYNRLSVNLDPFV
jgi:hypothetical protein